MKKAEYMEAKEHEKDAKKKLDEAAKTLRNPLSVMTYLLFTRCIVLNIFFLIANKSFIDKKSTMCLQ